MGDFERLMQSLWRNAGIFPPAHNRTLLDRIEHLREGGHETLKDGDATTASRLFVEAAHLAEVLGNLSLQLEIRNDLDYCDTIVLRDQGREKLKLGDTENVKEAEEILTQALAIADVARTRGFDRPELTQELYRDLDYCQALLLKEEGKIAVKSEQYEKAIELYTKALKKADMANRMDTFNQLLINRSIVQTKLGQHQLALEDAKVSVDLAPNTSYKGYFRMGQILKTIKRPREAIGAMRDGLAATDPPDQDRADFVTEIIEMTTVIKGQIEEVLTECKISGATWALVLEKIAKKRKWLQVKQLVLDESFDNMDICGKRVAVLDLVKYCKECDSRDAKLWGQILAKELMERRGSDFPEADCVAFMKTAMDLGIKTGDFRLLKYIFKDHVKTDGERNRKDKDGCSLYQYLVKSYDTGEGNALIALNLLGNHGIDVCTNERPPTPPTEEEKKTPMETTSTKDKVKEVSKMPESERNKPGVASVQPKDKADQKVERSKDDRGKQATTKSTSQPGPKNESKSRAGASVVQGKQVTTKPASMPSANIESAKRTGASDVQGKQGTTKTTATPSVNKASTSRAEANGGARPKENRTIYCSCKGFHNQAKQKQSYMHEKAVSLWVRILGKEDHNPKEHRKWRKQAQNGILEVLKKRKDVPGSLTTLAAEEYSHFVREARHLPDWNLMADLIKAYKKKHGANSIKGLAKDTDLIGYFDRPEHERDNSTLVKILEAGASTTKVSNYTGQPIIKEALDNNAWTAIPLLVEYGADVEAFSLEEGDTPLHAALRVAMTKDKNDNFNLLQQLLDLYRSEKEKFSYLNPSRQDKFGNTIFHIAAKTEDKEIGLNAVQFLFDKGVDPTLPNNDGKTALMCLKKKNDRRAQGIRAAGEEFLRYSGGDKAPLAPKKRSKPIDWTRQVSEDPTKNVAPAPADSGGLKIRRERPKTDVKGRNRDATQLLWEIEYILANLDSHEPDFSDDDTWADDDDARQNDTITGKVDAQPSVEPAQLKNVEPGTDENDLINDVTSKEAGTTDQSDATRKEADTNHQRDDVVCKKADRNDQEDDAVSKIEADTTDQNDDLTQPVADTKDQIEEVTPKDAGTNDQSDVTRKETDTKYQNVEAACKEAETIDQNDDVIQLVAADTNEPNYDVVQPEVDTNDKGDVVKPKEGDANDLNDDVTQPEEDTRDQSDVTRKEADRNDQINKVSHKESDANEKDDAVTLKETDGLSDVVSQMEADTNEQHDGATRKEAEANEQIDNVARKEVETNAQNDDVDHKEAEANEQIDAATQKETDNDYVTHKEAVTNDHKEAVINNRDETLPLEAEDPSQNATACGVNDDVGGNEKVQPKNEDLKSDVGGQHGIEGENQDESSEEDEEEDMVEAASFKGLEWEIECTSEVWNTLFKKNIDNKMRNRIFKKIRMLGSGEFDNQPHLRKRLHSVPPHIQLYEAKITKAARLIWEIAIAFSSRQSDPSNIKLTENQREMTSASGGKPIYSEVIRLWDIVFNHDHIYRSVQNVVNSHSKGAECLLQKRLEGIKGDEGCCRHDGKRIPRTFSEGDGGLEAVKFFPPASPKETEYHIMKWYNFDFLVTSIVQNQTEKIDFPFSVTEREYAIINIEHKPPSPLLLLGRSGTGKTTCCLYRLWSRFVAYWKRAEAEGPLIPRITSNIQREEIHEDTATKDDDNCACESEQSEEATAEDVPEDKGPIHDHLQQIFVTKNPILCTEINRNFKYLSHGCPEAQPHIAVEDEPLPNRLQQAHPCAFPLFATSKQFLLMLDASLPGRNFFPRKDDGSLEREVAGWGEEDGPLTFIPDVDDDYDDDVQEDEDRDQEAGDERARNMDLRQEVTYEIFAEQLWPEMVKMQKDKVTCHPSLVWTEINSFIKGSIESLHSEKGRLTPDEYEHLGRKRAPNFPGCREQVYQLYKSYSILLKRKRWFDEMDLIYHLYNRMKNMPAPEWCLHEVYVDETQDFTQAELALLIRCCHDPNMMFLTGDTAQSIMRGIAFRFEDLKSLFHYARESNQAKGKRNLVRVPKTIYQLIHNYRSHDGILHLATSLLDLIDRFFPASYDRKGLEKDRGLFEGPKPVLIDCSDYGDLAMVLCGNKRDTSQIEFGAHQAILVVNDEARDNLPEDLGFGLVLTIYESKGLEFDDVLLFNFFKDSQAKEEWRVVLQHLDEIIEEQDHSQGTCKELIEIDTEALCDKDRARRLDFDPEKHKILNSELKHLYTAVTRARVNIWIFDEDEVARKPMFRYFQARKLVKTVVAREDDDEEGMTELFKKSSAKEWKKRGDELLRKHLYKVAANCYRKANHTRLLNLCLANQHALAAKRVGDDKKLKYEMYLSVSLEYLRCHEYMHAARCLHNAKEFQLAATLYASDKLKKYKDAARLYKGLGDKEKACEMYELGGFYKDAIHLYYNLQKFNKAIDVLERYQKTHAEYLRRGEPIPERMIKHQPCPPEYCQICNLGKIALEAAQQERKQGYHKRMIQSLEFVEYAVAIDFLITHNLRELAAEFHQKHGRNVEAAELYKSLGKLDNAIECAEACGEGTRAHDLCAELKLEKARSLIQHTSSAKCDDLLKTAEGIFSKQNDSMKEAECLLLRGVHGDVDDKTRERCLFKAYQKFWSADCPAGEIESMYQAVKLLPGLFTVRECGNVILRCINLALEQVAWIESPTGGPTVKAVEAVKRCFRFYGMDTVGFQKKTQFEINHQEARIMKLVDHANLPVGEGRRIQKRDAQVVMVEDLLGEKMKFLWDHARSTGKIAKTRATMCPQYRRGFQCQASASGDGCPGMHRPHDRHSLETLVQASALLMQMDVIIARAKQDPNLQNERSILARFSDADAARSFFDICGIIFPTDRQEPVLFEDPKVTESILAPLRTAQAKEALLWNVPSKMKEFTSADGLAMYTSANLHFFLHTVYLLGGEKRKMHNLLVELEKDATPLTYIAYEVLNVTRNTKVRHHIFHYVVNMLTLLYDQRNPLHAIGNSNKYFFVIAKRAYSQMIPSFGHTMMMFEYQLALSCCTYLRNARGNEHAFLPRSFLAHIAFFDWALVEPGKRDTFAIVQNPKEWGDADTARLRGGLVSFVKLFCGVESQNFHMLSDVFAKGNPWIASGEAERVFVFALVLLINVNKVIPNTTMRSKRPVEDMLMADITAIDLDGLPCPARLRDAVEATKKAKGLKQIARILVRLLESRCQEELLDCTWRRSGKRNFHYEKLVKFDWIIDGFYLFRPAAVKEAKDFNPAPEEEPIEEEEEVKEQDEQVDAEYAKNVFEEQEAHQQEQEEPAEATEPTTPDQKIDVHLRPIDATMCYACGVMFADLPSGASIPTEAGISSAATVESPDEGAPAGMSRQISAESEPSVVRQVTRHDHESSEAHARKLQEHHVYFKHQRNIVTPLQDEAGSLREGNVKVNELYEKVTTMVQALEEKKDWGNIQPIQRLCLDLEAAIEDCKKKDSTSSKQPESYATAVGNAPKKKEVNDEDDLENAPDVVPEPSKRKKQHFRRHAWYNRNRNQ